jgi:prepilin-type N-terminal cleavage/methylation domain-containing protein
MRVEHRRSHQRGYTLVEVVVVIGIIGIVAALAMPMFGKVRDNARLRSSARDTIGKLQLARAMSVSHQGSGFPALPVNQPNNANPPNQPVNRPNNSNNNNMVVINQMTETVIATEFRIATTTRIELWNITDQGNESLAQIYDLRADDPHSTVEIVAPTAPAVIRFKNGIRDTSSPNQVDIVDRRTDRHTLIDVGVSGMRIRR